MKMFYVGSFNEEVFIIKYFYMLDIIDITIPELTGREKRKLYVYVPDMEGNFPVLYMFDGQNVFLDEDATFGKSWGMLEYLEENNVPLIVAAVECNHHDEKSKTGGRLSEYSPFDFSDYEWGDIKGRGHITMEFYSKQLKPYIDDNYPTKKERKYTFIAGSSMGGLMTLYALCKYNDVYSRGASLSPSVGFSKYRILEMIDEADFGKDTILYMDYGQQELKYRDSKYIYGEVSSALIRKNVLLDSRIVPKGKHNEASWQKAIPFFMKTLFYNL